MSRRILQEQPPAESPTLREWLTRVLNQINGAFSQIFDLEVSNMPNIIVDGMLRYFNQAIPPDIDYEGPWIVVDGVWRPMVGMVYQGDQVYGQTYYPQDVVLDGPWTMVANKKTTDPAAPQPTGPKETTLPDVPGFETVSNGSVVYSGHKYVFSQGGWFGGLRVWVPEVTASTNYRFIVVNITDPDNPITTIIEEPVLKPNEWTVVAFSNAIVVAGAEYLVYIDALNSGSGTVVTGGWLKGPVDNNVNPADQAWNTNTQQTILRIDKNDLDSVDRTSELLGIQAGSTIQFSLTDDPNNFIVYNINQSPTDGGAAIIFGNVVVADSSGTIPIGEPTTMLADVPIAQTTEYVRLLNHWSTNDPTWATIDGFLQFDGVDQPGNLDTAYGVDIAFTPGELSDDWDFLAYTRSLEQTTQTIRDLLSGTSINTNKVLEANTEMAQDPLVSDLPLQIHFGGAQSTTYFDLSASGTLTCKFESDYDIDIVFNTNRGVSPQTAYLVFWSEVNGVAGTGITLSLDSNSENKPLVITVEETLDVGDELEFFFARDSSGWDDGVLDAFIPINPVIPTTKSAWIQVTRRTLS